MIAELEQPSRSKLLWCLAVTQAFLSLESQNRIVRTYSAILAMMPILEYEVRRLDGGLFRNKKPKRARAEITSRQMPCPKTIIRWVCRFEEGGHDPLALLPRTNRCGNRELRWCHQTESMASEVVEFYACTQRPMKRQAVAGVQTRIKAENARRKSEGQDLLIIPSSRSLSRRLRQAGPYYTHARRYGIEAANRKFNQFETGVDTVFPGERVEMDENCLDVISLLAPTGILQHLPPEQVERLKGRRWLYTAKDCTTKCILAIRLAETPNAQDAIRTLRDVMHDRTPYALAAGCETSWDQVAGIGTLVTDQRSAFISEDFRSVAASLGLTLHFPPAGLPQMRGNIESFFRTLGHKLMPLLSGQAFFNPVDRGDYPSEQLACLDDDDLIRILLTFIVDIYHNELHGSLKEETPANCWKRLSTEQGLLPVPDELTLRKTFGRPMKRKLRGDGVRFANLSYSCDALREAFLHSPEREMEICADLFDLGWIAVKVSGAWHSVLCNHSNFEGISYSDWQEACRSLRIKHRKAASLSEEIIHRALVRISETNRAAALRMQLTPFHVTDAEITRNEESLHFSLTSSAEKLGGQHSGCDPLAEGIDILATDRGPVPVIAPQVPPSPHPQALPRTATWSFDDE